jgi:hypothetical protein
MQLFKLTAALGMDKTAPLSEHLEAINCFNSSVSKKDRRAILQELEITKQSFNDYKIAGSYLANHPEIKPAVDGGLIGIYSLRCLSACSNELQQVVCTLLEAGEPCPYSLLKSLKSEAAFQTVEVTPIQDEVVLAQPEPDLIDWLIALVLSFIESFFKKPQEQTPAVDDFDECFSLTEAGVYEFNY